ncbi:hypothetical protein AB0L57_14955 [Nocardia sp. NPDC052254]|uniref:hypothetical protein n=1 Tax=Nocardia sp. NPDC052254 TaxID=3155681 RepID=UPI00341B548A
MTATLHKIADIESAIDVAQPHSVAEMDYNCDHTDSDVAVADPIPYPDVDFGP